MTSDLRYALRQLRRSPGFALIAALTLALGIGANSALFALLRAVLYRGAPGVSDPSTLVWVAPIYQPIGRPIPMSYVDYVDYRDRTAGSVFGSLAVVASAPFALGGEGEPERVNGQIVSGNFFATIGARPLLGRFFAPEEDATPGTHPVVVISEALWRRRFGTDSSIVGREIPVNGAQYTVVGIAPAGFGGFELERPADVWAPTMMGPRLLIEEPRLLDERNRIRFTAIGRLGSGVSEARAAASVRTIAGQIAAAYPKEHEGMTTAGVYPVQGFREPGGTGDVGTMIGLGLGVTTIVLLICCGNVAGLLLGRAAARQREIGIRLALGASRWRLVRQLLVEGALLAIAGGALGLLFAGWASDLLLVLSNAPMRLEVSADGTTLGATLAIALGSSLLFGLAPALHAVRQALVPALRTQRGSLTGGRAGRSRLRGSLVVGQLALSLVLLVSAGLLVRSIDRANAIDVGFDARRNVVTMSFDLGLIGYSRERRAAFYDDLLERVSTRPGVETATIGGLVPLNGTMWGTPVSVEGQTDRAQQGPRPGMTFINNVRPGFFRTIGTPLVRGRDFTRADRSGAPGVVIANEAAVRRYWPAEDPIGHRLRLGDTGEWLTVVGVAKDGKYDGVGDDPVPYLYLAERQSPGYRSEVTLLVRAGGDAAPMSGALREVLRVMAPDLPVFNVRTMAQVIDQQFELKRVGRNLLTIFGGLAALLASIGLYGVIAFAVRLRVREIGVRVALGARDRDVLRLFVGQGLKLAATGVAIGVALAAALTQALRSVLLGVTPTDAAAFVAAAMLLGGVALLASYLPARRAARMEPMRALRDE